MRKFEMTDSAYSIGRYRRKKGARKSQPTGRGTRPLQWRDSDSAYDCWFFEKYQNTLHAAHRYSNIPVVRYLRFLNDLLSDFTCRMCPMNQLT
jgi:hypothetical protein